MWSKFFYFIRGTSPNKIYTNELYNISLHYPQDWVKIPGYEERYGANEYFMQISAISGGSLSLDQVASMEAFHELQPYGSHSFILSLKVQGQPAKLIYPSPDQPKEMLKQAALIVKYPYPIKIGGVDYDYFILWADRFHIRSIAESIQFLKRC